MRTDMTLSDESLRRVEEGAAAHRAVLQELSEARQRISRLEADLTEAHHEGDMARVREHDLTEKVNEAVERAMRAEVDAKNARNQCTKYREKMHNAARILAGNYDEPLEDGSRPAQMPQDEPKADGGEEREGDNIARAIGRPRLAERVSKLDALAREYGGGLEVRSPRGQ